MEDVESRLELVCMCITCVAHIPPPFVNGSIPAFLKAIIDDDAGPDRRIGDGLDLRDEDGGDRRYGVLENVKFF